MIGPYFLSHNKKIRPLSITLAAQSQVSANPRSFPHAIRMAVPAAVTSIPATSIPGNRKGNGMVPLSES